MRFTLIAVFVAVALGVGAANLLPAPGGDATPGVANVTESSPAPAAAAPAGAAHAYKPAIKLVYIGVRQCPACRYWKEESLPDWRADPLSRDIRLIQLEKPTFQSFVPGSFGSYNWLIRSLEDEGRLNAVPRFVVLSDRDIKYVGNWKSAVRRVEKLHRRNKRG